MARWKRYVLRRNTTEVGDVDFTLYQGYILSNLPLIVDVNNYHLSRGSFVELFLHSISLSSCFSSSGRKPPWPNSASGEVCFISLKLECLHKLFEFVLTQIFVSSPYFNCSHIYLYHCGCMDVYFICLALIQYWFLWWLKLFQFWRLGAFVDSCVSLIFHYHCGLFFIMYFLRTPYFSVVIWYCQFVLYISCSTPRISHFSKALASLFVLKDT